VVNHPMAADLRQARLDLARARQRHAQVVAEVRLTLSQRADLKPIIVDIAMLEEKLSGEKDVARRVAIAQALLELRAKRSAAEAEVLGMDANVTVALADVTHAVAKLRAVETEYAWHLNKDPRRRPHPPRHHARTARQRRRLIGVNHQGHQGHQEDNQGEDLRIFTNQHE
jgi:hypothetical protein